MRRHSSGRAHARPRHSCRLLDGAVSVAVLRVEQLLVVIVVFEVFEPRRPFGYTNGAAFAQRTAERDGLAIFEDQPGRQWAAFEHQLLLCSQPLSTCLLPRGQTSPRGDEFTDDDVL